MISVPPLRERRADIAPLIQHLLARLGGVHGRPEARLDPAAMRLLESYEWPGNVRELKNAIEHALTFAKYAGKEAVFCGPRIFRRSFSAQPLPAPWEKTSARSNEMESEAIRATLEATHYKISRAAEILGISRKTLLEKRKKYGLL